MKLPAALARVSREFISNRQDAKDETQNELVIHDCLLCWRPWPLGGSFVGQFNYSYPLPFLPEDYPRRNHNHRQIVKHVGLFEERERQEFRSGNQNHQPSQPVVIFQQKRKRQDHREVPGLKL